MKQTAVQWLIDEYFGGIENCTPDFRYHINKALEMEKEQHCKTWAEGLFCHTGDLQAFHDYYNETYETQTN